ncbi:DUF2569 family protein [Paraburkholderia fungorum]|jgi:hypothetical protein|uniref:DUF2569 family protein n=1 Tax=Paraburkholderia fungorum TaxID=134537 RepID=UPI0038BBB387
MNITTKPEPKGIGGWLLLPLGSLALSLAWDMADLISLITRALATCRSGCDGGTLRTIGVAPLFDLAGVAIVVWLLMLAYRRSKRFSKWIQIVLLTSAAFGIFGGLVEYLAMMQGRKGQPSPEVWVQPLAYALIWIPYFKWSRRVKNTFTQA